MTIDEKLRDLVILVREADTELDRLIEARGEAHGRELITEIGDAWEIHMHRRKDLLRHVMENY
jgi:hypothetical protein